MRKRGILFIVLAAGILILLFLLIRPFINIAVKVENLSKDKWQEDIEYLRKNLPEKHANLFFKITKQEFNDSIDKLEQKLNELDSDEIQMELMSIISNIGDSHTNISNFESNNKYPFNAEWFKEGLFIVGISSQYENALGCKITEINGVPIAAIINKINTLIPHENEFLLKWKNPILLQEPKVLRHLGILNKESKNQDIVVTLSNQENRDFKIKILPEKSSSIKWINAVDKIHKKSLYLDNNDDFYIKFNETDKLIYCRFNNTIGHPSNKELALLKEMLQEKQAEKLIIDIRDNTGGLYTGNSSLINIISESSYFNQKGRLFVIVGRKTFSSGLQYAFEFKNKTNAIFYGEPTAGKPNHYGNIRSITLPNSKLSVSYSTKYFQYGNGEAFIPEVIVEYSIKDYLEGIDSVVERIKSDYK